MRRCFQNAHAWRTRCDDLVRVGFDGCPNTLAIAAEITNSADILLIVLDAALRQERSDFKPIAPAKREASPARLTTPKKVKTDSPPKPFWRLQAERLWSKVTKHEWVRNDGLQSYGGKLQWFRPTVADSASVSLLFRTSNENGVKTRRRGRMTSTRHVNDVRQVGVIAEHYLGVIAKPMDLGLINHKLVNDEYEGESSSWRTYDSSFRTRSSSTDPASSKRNLKRTKSAFCDGRPRGEDLRHRDALVELRGPPRARVLQGRHRRPAGDAGHRGVDHAQRD